MTKIKVIFNKKAVLLILTMGFCISFLFSTYGSLSTSNNINPEGTTLSDTVYLVGPDSYYNMQTCEHFIRTGEYRIEDPMLNYPIDNKGARPPLFNAIAIVLSFGNLEVLGWLMLLLPSIYGALLVFPMYFIGKELFNKKIAIVSALTLSVIPSISSASNGSVLGLFDHDSFLLLLFLLFFLFYIKALKGNYFIYGLLTAITLIMIYLTWVMSFFFFFLPIAFLLIKLLVDIIKEDYDSDVYFKTFIIYIMIFVFLPTVYLLTNGESILFEMTTIASCLGICFVYYIIFTKLYGINKNIPIVLYIAFIVAFFAFLFLFQDMEVPIVTSLTNFFFKGIYSNKVFVTIQEGSVYNLGKTVLLTGTTIFWLGFGGLIVYFYKTIKDNYANQNILFMTFFVVFLWLTTQTGRFTNYVVLFLVLLTVYLLYRIVLVNKKKSLIVVLSVVLIAPSALTLIDQTLNPYEMELEKQSVEYCSWLSTQDMGTPPAERPAVISWWDYGFFISAVGKHPVVADNFQSGVSTASVVFTSTSEKELISCLIVRILDFLTPLPENLTTQIKAHTDSDNLSYIINNRARPAKFNSFHSAELKMYEDTYNELSRLSDKEVNDLYRDIIVTTGYEIGYISVTKRDVLELAPIILYLANKSNYVLNLVPDKYYLQNGTANYAFYDTMMWKIYDGETLSFFKEVYINDNVRILKYRW